MPDTPLLILFIGLVLIIFLQVFLALRKQKVEMPAELHLRLEAVEQTSRATLQAVSKSEGALEGFAQQMRAFTQTTSTSMESVRQAVDEKLAQTIAESRQGRIEILTAFQGFESTLEQRLGGMDVSLGKRFEALQTSTTVSLETNRQAIDEKLTQIGIESRNGRTELVNAFQGFEEKLERRLISFDTSLTQRLDALQSTVASRLEESANGLLAHLVQSQGEAATARKELNDALTGFRAELTAAVGGLGSESVKSREAMTESAKLFEMRIQERFETLTGATRQTLDSLKADINSQLSVMSTALKDQLEGNSYQIKHQFSAL